MSEQKQAPVLTDEQFDLLLHETKLQTAQQAAFQKKMMDAFVTLAEASPKRVSDEQSLAEKRDWFAGQALASWPVTDQNTAAELATKCYALADAMLAARDGGSHDKE